MLFIALMFITTTCVAGAAAFFSVYGLAHTFAASFWSVVFMGGALEAGKLMLASYLYRFKDAVTLKAKALGYVFVFVLMMITSLGIYGYLADAYQSGTTDMKQVNASLQLKKEEQANLQKRKEEIDTQIAAVPATDTRGKQRIMRQFGPEITKVNDRLSAISTEIQQEVQKQITADSHVGPIVFVAKIFGIAPDNAISLLILAIVFVFDPVAIYLTIATNTALAKYKDEKKARKADSVDLNPREAAYFAAGSQKEEVETFTKKDADEWHEFELPQAANFPEVPLMVDHDSKWAEFTKEIESAFPEIDTDLPSTPLVEEVPLVDVPAVSKAADWELEPIVMDLVTTDPALHPERTSDVEVLPGGELEPFETIFPVSDPDAKGSHVERLPISTLTAPEVSFIVTDDNTPYYPPPRQPADPERMKVLGELFSKEPTEDVAAEEGTEAPPEQQLAKIYEEVAAKDVTEQTPVDIETMKRIEQFFQRQNLIKNVRSGQ
jgi:hypothetical protein